VIPAYNHADYLYDALVSAYSSLSVDLEVIVVDDGSTDHTESIVQKFPEARYFKQRNMGAFAAINTGVSLSSHKRIAILNDDDLYTPHYLSNVLKVQSFTGAELVATRPTLTGSGDKLHQLVFHQQVAQDKLSELGPHLSLLSINWFISTSGLVFNRNLFDAIGGFRDLDMHHDIDFVLRAAFSGNFQFASNLDGSWKYRCHTANASSKIKAKNAKTEIPLFLQIPLRELSNNGVSKNQVLKLLGHGMTEIEKIRILDDYNELKYLPENC
jgi:glycosyltransferase involved in cell wall biosynthesis